jgi:hypothetical protein
MIGGDIHELTFGPEGNPDTVEQDAFVPEGATVTIQAGTVLIFKPFTGLKVDGDIVVEGTAEAPVVFTSIHDTDHGPSTGQLPNAFDWNGVQLTATCTKAHFAHFQLKYSVHGIMASTVNVVVDNGVFVQNGQFHLKIADKLHFVQDNVPYSYRRGGTEAPAKPVVAAKPGRGKDKWEIKPARTKKEKRKLAIRYVCLGAAAIGAGTGTYFAIRSIDYANQRDTSPPSGPEWDSLDESRINMTNAGTASFVVGGAFLLGFGVTFFF